MPPSTSSERSFSEVPSDFRELLECLNAHAVDYLIVGSYALAFHGAPRTAGNIDLLVKPDPQNAQRILAALGYLGFGSLQFGPEAFQRPDRVVQLGDPPVRADLITSISGVSWEEAWDTREAGVIAGVPVHFIGRGSYITNKRAAGRPKDLADIVALGEDA